MPKEETARYYEEKARTIIHFIRENLGQDLSVKSLAERAGISIYHFHRIIKAYLGVSLGKYITGQRLNEAARLLKDTRESIGDIAMNIGYQDLSALTKAFSREFGMSPNEFRQHAESRTSTRVDFRFEKDAITTEKLKPKLMIVPRRDIIYIPMTGEYGDEACVRAWDSLLEFATRKKLAGWSLEAFSIYYDDPEVVGPENCRYDICMTVKKKIEPEGEVLSRRISGGKYLVFRYKGPYEKLWDLYEVLYRDYLLATDLYRLRDEPIMERYVKYSAATRPENLVTDIYIPIE